MTKLDKTANGDSVTSNALLGCVLPCGAYTKVGDEMTWPSFNQGELEWQCRYAQEYKVVEQRYVLASIVAAYRELIAMPQKRRNELCKVLREAT